MSVVCHSNSVPLRQIYDRASEDDIYETLSAPPVDDIDHPYSLEEIRQSPYLRDRMRRLDLDTITFDFGSWEVDPRDYGRLERLARVHESHLSRAIPTRCS